MVPTLCLILLILLKVAKLQEKRQLLDSCTHDSNSRSLTGLSQMTVVTRASVLSHSRRKGSGQRGRWKNRASSCDPLELLKGSYEPQRTVGNPSTSIGFSTTCICDGQCGIAVTSMATRKSET